MNTKNLLIIAGVGVVAYLIYQNVKSKDAGYSNAVGRRTTRNSEVSGKHGCYCRNRDGQLVYQECWRSKTGGDCDKCCGHYGKENSGLF